MSDASLRRTGRIWTAITVGHTVPFVAVAALLLALNPVTAAVALMALAQAWIIPELYAARGANVLRARAPVDERAERVSVGLLGDLLDHRARDLHCATGVVLERGLLGV
ncbi:MAG TPA: hypothetical protein VFI54_05360, partial [Solirubrobacteraceae bacterium]|nr:hypothetical protein [Solirubrobacteraceae bacterium]